MFFSLGCSKRYLLHEVGQWSYSVVVCVCVFPHCVTLLYTGTKSCCAIMLTEAHLTPCRHANTHSHMHTHTGIHTNVRYIPTTTRRAAHIHTAQGAEGYSNSIFSFPNALSKGTDLSFFPLALNMHVSQPFMWALSCVLCKKSWGYFLILAAHQFFIFIS